MLFYKFFTLLFCLFFFLSSLLYVDVLKQKFLGGGCLGCNTLYHLAKRGVQAILLERDKLTSGTTWHTGGLLWTLRPDDVQIQLLQSTRNLLISLKDETGIDPGWINNGGLYVAHNQAGLDPTLKNFVFLSF